MPEAINGGPGDWFWIEGAWHLIGWYLSAIATPEAWFGFAVCPRCFAMVQHDRRHPWDDRRTQHERWHAATDWPVPDAITDTRPQ
jgi:hypothetical protein